MDREELEKKLDSIGKDINFWEEWAKNTQFAELNSDDIDKLNWLMKVVKMFKDELEHEGIEPAQALSFIDEEWYWENK